MLAGYVVLLLAETVLIRKVTPGSHFQPEIFWSWKQWEVQRNQILTNVVMFVPVGLLAGKIWRWRGIWFAAGMSIVIEVLQLVTSRGLCEIDDVIHNMIGTAVGVGIVMILRKLLVQEAE